MTNKHIHNGCIAIVIALLGGTLLNSCAPVKICTLSSSAVPTHKTVLQYDNDSLRITYDFWSTNGRLRYSIENKLAVPIFVDLNQTQFLKYAQGNNPPSVRNYWSNAIYTWAQTNITGGEIYAQSQQQARYKMIAPRTRYTCPHAYMLTSTDFITHKHRGKYDSTNSPLRFRLLVAYGFSENTAAVMQYVDHDFYVSEVLLTVGQRPRDMKASNRFYLM